MPLTSRGLGPKLPAMKPTEAVREYGQSIWYDFIERRMIWSGRLHHMVAQEGLRGVTSNPSIFEKAMGGSEDYGPAMAALARAGATPAETFEALAVEDIQWACDVFREVYDSSKGLDGYVSLEVSPHLAYDALGTIEDAHRLWSTVSRDNLMVKVPGTEPGLEAIEQLLADGLNINVTLLFSVERYQQVFRAHERALHRRLAAGLPVDHVASVASFFVSRIDGVVDPLLVEKAPRLQGKVAIANAERAHAFYRHAIETPEHKTLVQAGAKPQRLLWASTSTKNPSYPDTLYVDRLIGPDTVNTVPAATYEAFNDHGSPKPGLEGDGGRVLDELPGLGVDLSQICADLETKGVLQFADAFDRLIGAVAQRRSALLDGRLCTLNLELGALQSAYEGTCARLDEASVARRLWERDGHLFSSDDGTAQGAAAYMGWLDAVDDMEARIEELDELQDDILESGVESVVLMGMGGSSLAPDVFRRMLPQVDQAPELVVLDGTHPASVQRVLDLMAEGELAFIVASKSGGTAEVVAFHDVVAANVQVEEDEVPGDRFIAITDPGTALEERAVDEDFWAVIHGDPEIGGRFSALSPFGLVPAVAMGLDAADLLERARLMVGSCGPELRSADNEGLRLAAALGAGVEAGRNKLVLHCSPGAEPLGDWLEQLIMESTGKSGKGVVVVQGRSESDGPDRMHVCFAVGEEPMPEVEGPQVGIRMPEAADLVQEMFRWEFATAALGHLLGINPFDQPDVQASKTITKELLATEGSLPTPTSARVVAEEGPWKLETFSDDAPSGELVASLGALASSVGVPAYLAVHAFIDMSEEARAAVGSFRDALARKTEAVTTFGFGPRYLHSTGQLHKGGPDGGVFLQLWDEPEQDVALPGRDYGFERLLRAQELGDLQALLDAGRRVFRLGLGRDPVKALRALTDRLNAGN